MSIKKTITAIFLITVTPPLHCMEVSPVKLVRPSGDQYVGQRRSRHVDLPPINTAVNAIHPYHREPEMRRAQDMENNYLAKMFIQMKKNHDVLPKNLNHRLYFAVSRGYYALAWSLLVPEFHFEDERRVTSTIVLSPDSIGENGDIPLLEAARSGNLNMVTLLLQSGANPNLQDLNGNTALHYAIMNNHLATASQLLAFHASARIKNSRGSTAIDLATKDKAEYRALFEGID